MLMSDHRLPQAMDPFLDSEMAASDFAPEPMPTEDRLIQVVDSEPYKEQRPEAWEKPSLLDAIMFKTLFTVTRVRGRGDNLKKHWLGHRANHAHFVSRVITTGIDGKPVPYGVTPDAGICSSCVEFFNVTDDNTRKLVSACPGAVTFGGAKRDVYYDVKPGDARDRETDG